MANHFSTTVSQLIALIKQPPSPGTRRPYPKLRNFILDVMAEGRRKNTINLLFEADLTPIQQHLAQYAVQHGGRISMTTYIAKSLACAIDEDKTIHAYRYGKSKLMVFDDIDLSIMVEREIDGETMPITLIVRAANHKHIGDIYQELQAAKTAPLGEHGPMSALEKQFFELPSPLRKIIWFFIRRDPHLFKQLAGTVGITSMGMHASGPAVIIPITPMTLTLSIGAISKRLVLEDSRPVERDFIQMNLGANHDIIDGAPLMRFADRFKQKLQTGCALAHPQSTQ
ncbi:hypothetical protein TPL01_12210 [Sulfuriferula plumbiphila]|uniref:2-oxoacid dehydrogenase acyltransferase catalytic domain-containing protein n=1 Tax=Sulfuriferula plumbiphila TaxID=171865 RepID=A0A512L6H1_9PROT|nr:2-oxo acid dehydrogenase subunit E2 [Sulfuriferula plumbiphila]BBP04810.1 hypothetical protein SFPGR_22320 [Sulfuriferula plumbiphila]GEP30083.1 hypothetical protein TPL01_12210 [Sulfuriferula plumbiphila]